MNHCQADDDLVCRLGRVTEDDGYLLEAARDEYYTRLLSISRGDDRTAWCAFFLRAVISQAETNQRKAQAILRLYQDREDWMIEQPDVWTL